MTAQERYEAMVAQQVTMGARIDELRDEVRSTMTSVRECLPGQTTGWRGFTLICPKAMTSRIMSR